MHGKILIQKISIQLVVNYLLLTCSSIWYFLECRIMYIHVYSLYRFKLLQAYISKGNVLLCVFSDLNSKKENIINDKKKNMAENIDGTNLYYFFFAWIETSLMMSLPLS